MELYNRNLPETGVKFEQRIETTYYGLLEGAKLSPQAVGRLTVGDILNTVVYCAGEKAGEEVIKKVGEELGVTLTSFEIEIVNSTITELNEELTKSILESRDSLWKNRLKIKPKDIEGILTETAKKIGDHHRSKLENDKKTYQNQLDKISKSIKGELDKLALYKGSRTIKENIIELNTQAKITKRKVQEVEIKVQATKIYTEMVVGIVEKPNKVIKQGLRSAAEIMSGKPPFKSESTPVESLWASRSEGIAGERTPLNEVAMDANENYPPKRGEKAPSGARPIKPEITM
jgi:hypothetical protein